MKDSCIDDLPQDVTELGSSQVYPVNHEQMWQDGYREHKLAIMCTYSQSPTSATCSIWFPIILTSPQGLMLALLLLLIIGFPLLWMSLSFWIQTNVQ